MKTSETEIAQTEKFLLGDLPVDEQIVFQAKLLVNEELRTNTFFHGMVHKFVRFYHRRKLRKEIDAIHDRLFSDPSKVRFRESIFTLFNR